MGLNKGADWKEILSSTERRNFLSKGSGKGGKGHDKGGSACRVRRQGTKRSSLEHNVFKVYDIYDMPVVTVNERNGPLPFNSITEWSPLKPVFFTQPVYFDTCSVRYKQETATIPFAVSVARTPLHHHITTTFIHMTRHF